MNKKKAISTIEKEIEKIDKKENNIFFYVIDTEGYASGSLAYIYHLAKFLSDDGYNVGMLYQLDKDDEKFIGVEGWLGTDYSSLPHYDVRKDEITINPSDVLFIPDIFTQVMNQTKKLPCKRIVIMQNFDYVIAQMPFSAQFGDYGIVDVISNTTQNASLIKSVFPYLHTTVIDPFIEKLFGETKEPKIATVNIVAKDENDISRILKPFYWKYPLMKWVSFKDLKGMSKENFANALREGFLTIWIDEDASFGYSAIEAMKCGNVVLAKAPKVYKDWMLEPGSQTQLNKSCFWFDDINQIHDKIAQIVRAFITDKIPEEIFKNQEDVKNMYSEENTKKQIIEYVSTVLTERRNALSELLKAGNKENNKTKEDK
jgi:hypothetical protein